jgi:DUF4097 and DUF4098 domain-containing protein YvlB
MRNLCLIRVTIPALAALTCGLAFGQTGNWQKAYPVSGKASLTISVGDASLDLRSCGACRQIQVQVDWRDRRPSDYYITEFQSADHVNFELKEKQHLSIHIGNWRGPEVTVETPASLDLEARTADGSLKVSGVQGTIALETSDGSVAVDDVGGSVRLKASDGSIHMHNVTGTLESRSSDGSVSIDGQFTALEVHTSDGSLELTLANGTQLTSPSRIESSDGTVKLHVPRTLSADLDVHTSDGSVRCDLPLKMDGYDSSHTSGHNLRGHLNSGGTPLEIHTSDGNVSIEAL